MAIELLARNLKIYNDYLARGERMAAYLEKAKR